MIRSKPQQNRQNGHLISGINITPFTDVCLVLLIIFMVTTSTLTRDSCVQMVLPKSTNTTPMVPKLVTIHITSDQRFDVNNEPLRFEGLLPRLHDYYKRDAESVVVVRADQAVPYQAVISAIDAARSVGFEEFDLATQQPDPTKNN